MKKRILASLLAVVMVVTSILTPMGNEVSVFAMETGDVGQTLSEESNAETSGTCGETATWRLEDGTLTISGSGEMENYTYDSQVPWYSFRDDIESITITDGISTVGDYAFYNCQSVNSVSMSDSVKVIGDNAFYGCTILQEVELPAYIEKIGEDAFYGSAITQLYIPKSLSDCEYPFSNCDALCNVTFETGITKIPKGLFDSYSEDFDSLVSIEIPNTVIEIGDCAFWGCRQLTSITIPESVIKIGSAVFHSEAEITIYGMKYSYIEAYAYNNDLSFVGLGEIANGIVGNNEDGIPDINMYSVLIDYADCNNDGVLSIGELETVTWLDGDDEEIVTLKGLEYCKNLHQLNLAENKIKDISALTSLNNLAYLNLNSNKIVDISALRGLNNLTYLNLSSNRIVDISALGELNNLSDLNLTDNRINDFSPIEGKNIEELYIGEQRETTGTCGETVTWTLTGGTLTISGSGEMENYTYDLHAPWYDFREDIESIIITDGISTVGDYAFYNCESVNSVSMPDSVKVIGSSAFMWCEALEEVDLPAYVEEIGKDAFYGLAITDIHIPKSLVDCEYAFGNCDNLCNVTFETGITMIPAGLFADTDGFKKLTSIEIPNTVTTIGEYAFGGCTQLTSIIIPECVTNLSWRVFTTWDVTLTIYGKKHSYVEAFAYSNGFLFESIGEIPNGIVKNDATGMPDAVLYNTLVKEYDHNKDGLLSVGELETVTIFDSRYYDVEGISRLKGMEYCKNIDTLYIVDGNITNLDALSNLTKLKDLALRENKIEDITPLKNLTSLEYLMLSYNYIKDITPLSGLTNLTELYLSGNKIEDFSPIEGLNIESLDISHQRIYDFSELHVSIMGTKFYTYDGTAKQPKVTVWGSDNIALEEGFDYTVSYKNNVYAGTATVIITEIGGYAGTAEMTFTINPASINDATVTLEKTSYTYDGKAKTPSVTVKVGNRTLTAGTDYTVSYKNNKNIGEATITITGKGNYTGTIIKTFTIEVKKGATFTSGKYKYKVTGSSTVAFAGIKSTKTTKVTIPETVKYGGATFKVTSIADNALKGKTKVTSVTIPSTVTKIGKKAFYGCKNLKTITINAEKLTKIGSSALKGINSKATIKVPTEKYSSYKKLLKDKGQGSKVSIVIHAKKGDTFTSGNNKYKVTGSSTVEFTGLKSTKKTEVSIPKTVKYGGKTFKVTAIAEKALKGNTKVKKVTVGENVKKIGASAFYGCKNLKTITIKSTKLESVGKNAFKKISSKATIKVPKSKLTSYKKLLKGKGQGSKVKIVKYK